MIFLLIDKPLSTTYLHRLSDHMSVTVIEKGDTDTFQFGDVTAHVFQHEYDHLDGITFRQRATRFHWDQAKNKKKKLDKLRKRNERANQTFI